MSGYGDNFNQHLQQGQGSDRTATTNPDPRSTERMSAQQHLARHMSIFGSQGEQSTADTSQASDHNSFEHRLLQRQLNNMKRQTLLDIGNQPHRLDGSIMREINVLIDYVKSRDTPSPSEYTNERSIEALKLVKRSLKVKPLLQALRGELSQIEYNMREEQIQAQAQAHQQRLAAVQQEYDWMDMN